jgi:hypothetical protein
MFCKHCGNGLLELAKFCSKCGKKIESENPLAGFSRPPIKNPFPTIWKSGCVALGALIIAPLFFVKASSDLSGLILSIVNICLGLLGLVSVIGIIVGIILCIIFFQRSSESPQTHQHYRQMAIYSIATPIVLMIGVIIAFVIIRVISNLTQ